MVKLLQEITKLCLINLVKKNPICSRIEEQIIEFWKKNHEKYLQYKNYLAKTYDR